MKAKFKKFLTDNRAYKKFVRNIKIDRNISFNKYCDINEDWDVIIGRAFSWYCSLERFPYWDMLNEKWLKLLENND